MSNPIKSHQPRVLTALETRIEQYLSENRIQEALQSVHEWVQTGAGSATIESATTLFHDLHSRRHSPFAIVDELHLHINTPVPAT